MLCKLARSGLKTKISSLDSTCGICGAFDEFVVQALMEFVIARN